MLRLLARELSLGSSIIARLDRRPQRVDFGAELVGRIGPRLRRDERTGFECRAATIGFVKPHRRCPRDLECGQSIGSRSNVLMRGRIAASLQVIEPIGGFSR